MQLLDKEIDLDGFLARVATAPKAALLLDYDGTLAPFRVERLEAAPYPGLPELLSAIVAEGTRVVVISGRNLDELVALLGMDPLPELWSDHGWRTRGLDGVVRDQPLPLAARNDLAAAIRWAESNDIGERFERKYASVAVHWRGLPDDARDDLRRRANEVFVPIADAGHLSLKEFDGGLELRVPGRDKGDAVNAVLASVPRDAPVAFLGDDLTDEDAFVALGERGLRVLVRPTLRETEADVWISPPDELFWFLNQWRAARRGGQTR